MARRSINKRILAILLTLVMVFNLTGLGTFAAESTEPTLVENFQDTYYKQDGTVGSSEDWEIHLSKTAAPAGQDNVFDITLTVETKDISTRLSGATHAAVALVLDVSSSMDKDTGTCADCGKAENHSDHRGRDKVCDYEDVTHLALLKYAVKSFLDSYADTAAEGDKRMVAIVKFATDANTVLSWIDVSDESNLTTVKNAVDAMGSTSGTNIEAGLALGRNVLNMSELSDIPLGNQSLILFSDGSPTVAVGNASNTSTTHVGSDGRGVNAFGGNSSKDDLAGILSGVSAKKKAVAYNTDAALLNSVFGAGNVVASSAGSLIPDLTAEADKIITSKTNASTVTDPMGTGVSMISVSSGYENDSQKWDLSAFVPTVEDGITTYTITYRVELDPEAVAEDSNHPGYTMLTPANGATTLDYTYGENNTPVSVDFNEPSIRGVYSYTVSYTYVGDVPAGAPEAPAAQTYKAGQFVQVADAPVFENYTFSGWSRTDFTMPAEDVVITGSWNENAKYDYSVIYNSNFGTNETKADAENITGTYKAAYAIEVDGNEFVRENYTFIGWATEPQGEVVYAPGNVISFEQGGSEELFAVWMEHDKYSYLVIYNGNGGALEDSAISYGDAENVTGTYATAHTVSVDSNAFIRDNYDFIGWNTAADGTGIGYTAEEAVNLTAENNSLTLYALWAEHEKYDYTVIYNEGYGENPAITADSENVVGTYETFKTITVDENIFTREHYNFLGWATEFGGEVVYLPGMALNFIEGGSEELFAVWQEHSKYSYALVYDGNGGQLPGGLTKISDEENIQDIYDTTYAIGVNTNDFVRENYTFIGWNTAADGTGTAYTPDSVMTLTAQIPTGILYAQWIENEKYDYSVIYNANFGAAPATRADSENVTGIYETAYTIRTDDNTFVRANYTFAGWNTNPDGTGTAYSYTDLIGLTAESNTVTLYAQWIENEKYDYSVTYNAGYGLFPATLADEENVFQTYAETYAIEVNANTFVRANHDFIGWATEVGGAVTFLAGDEIVFEKGGSEELFAVWAEHDKHSYTLVYNGNGGTLAGGEKAYGDEENVAGTYATTYDMTVDENGFAREHYDFIGWNTAADGTGTAYAAQDVVNFTAENNSLTLYAQWEEHEKFDYEVIYYPNGGDDTDPIPDSENENDTYDPEKTITVDDNPFVNENEDFIGWSTEPEGEVVYKPGDTIEFTEGGSEELYAQWEPKDREYTVEYLVQIDDTPYVPFEGEVPAGGTLPHGTLVGKDIVNPPAEISDSTYTYTYVTIQEIVLGEGENVVKVYFRYETPAAPVEPAPEAPVDPAPEAPVDPEPADPATVDGDGLVELPDEDVPLAEVPHTGDPMLVYAGITLFSGAGLAYLGLGKKKEEED